MCARDTNMEIGEDKMFFEILGRLFVALLFRGITCLLAVIAGSLTAFAGDLYELEDITVTGEVLAPVKQAGDALYSGSMITREGLELKGAPAASSIYEAVDLLPGVCVESTDPYGLGRKNTRFRGIKSMLGSITVEGMPDYGIMPIGPRESVFDTENITGIALFQGASPTSLGTGNGNKGGSIELYFKRPEEEAGIGLKEALGTNGYTRTFVRMDTGRLPTDTGIFASYSYTDAEKWKGPGEIGPRRHVDVGLVQNIAGVAEIDGFFSFNDADGDSFRPLRYSEAKDHDFFRLDFNENRTGNPGEDRYFFKFNTHSATNRDFRFILKSTDAGQFFFSIKPYYSNEDAWRTETVTKVKGGQTRYFMLKKITDLDRIGVIPELRWKGSAFALSGGYWFESAGLDKYVKKYAIVSSGLRDLGYSYFSDSDGRGYVHSPYIKASGEYGRFSWQAGIKYFYYSEPESRGYMTDSSGQLSRQSDLDLDKQSWDVWLPSAGIGYEITDSLQVYANYGRTYVRPYMYVPVTNLYVENRTAFNAAGMVLQDIFDRWDMETADTIDVGFRYRTGNLALHPVFFYARHHDVLVNAYDPAVGVNYYQNDGEARTLGFELDATAYLPWGITLFFNPSYTDLEFTDDLERNGSPVKIDGKQLPDVPKWIVKGGVIYAYEGFEIAPMLTFVSKRYGDALHEESVPSHGVVDLALRYRRDSLWQLRNLSVNLEFRNLLDSHHVGIIDLFDDGAAGAASYYSAAPFSAVFSINASW